MKKVLTYLVPVVTLLTVAINLLAGVGQINNITPQTISDKYSVYFVPAGYVFSIWGLIYVGLIAYSYYQSKSQEDDIAQSRSLFIVSCLANVSWIFLWHYEHPLWSVIAMVVLLICLVTMYMRLQIGRKKVSMSRTWLVNFPISIYLGWISVATIANITVAFYVLKWDGFGLAPEFWGAVYILIAMILGLFMLVKRNDITYCLVLIWSITGLGVKFQEVGIISIASLFAIIVLIAMVVYSVLMRHQETIISD